MNKNGFELDFLDRTLRTTGIVLLIFLPFSFYYFGAYPTLAIFSGGIWGMINFIFISAMVRAFVRSDGPDRQRSIALSLIKFPLLYGSGYFLLKINQFEPLYLLIGFSSLMGILVLKVLGRVFLSLDETPTAQDQLQEAN